MPSTGKIGSLRANPSRRVWALLVACALVYLPLVTINGLFWDDWPEFWHFWVGGVDRLREFHWQTAHYGYFPPNAFLHEVGQAYYGSLGRFVGVVAHTVNSYLLYLILRRPRLTRPASVWAAAIFLLAPFYFARGIAAYYHYDLFLLPFLLSVWLLRFERRGRDVWAWLCYAAALSFEILLFLEPLRLLFVYRRDRGIAHTIRRVRPFWAIGLAFVAARVWLFKGYGDYAGYNRMNFDPVEIILSIGRHGRYFVRTIETVVLFAWALAGPAGFAAIGLAALATGVLAGRRRLKLPSMRIDRRLVALVALAVVISMFAALPYALTTHQEPLLFRFGRQTFVSMIGASILAAALMAAIPYASLRGAAIAVLLGVMSLSSLHASKWFMYDSLLQRDIVMQLDRAIEAGPDEMPLIGVHMYPESQFVTALGRYFSRDLIVPLNMMRDPSLPPVFVLDADRYSRDRTWSREDTARDMRGRCSINSGEMLPCPDEVVFLDYRLRPAFRSVQTASYWTLLGLMANRSSTAPVMGTLEGLEKLPKAASPRSRGAMRPGGQLIPNVMGFRRGQTP